MSDKTTSHASTGLRSGLKIAPVGLAPNKTPKVADNSDLAQAAAGLLSVGKFTPENCNPCQIAPPNCPYTISYALKSPHAVSDPNPAATTDNHLNSAAARAVGLRSLQAVESMLRSQKGTSIPVNPLTGIDGDNVTAEEQQAWKRARSCVYTARNRAKKAEQIKVLEEGIGFFKRQLGMQTETKMDEQQDSPPQSKKPSKLKGVKRNIYLPPKEKLNKMTDEEISEWKRMERMKRKREANAATAKEQQEKILQLAIEHEMLHEQYKAKCSGSGNGQQILGGHGQNVER